MRAEAEYSSAPLQGRNNLSIAVSTVTGRLVCCIRILYNYELLQVQIKLLYPGCLPRWEVEEDISEALLIVDNYNLLLYNVAATSTALLLMIMHYV